MVKQLDLIQPCLHTSPLLGCTPTSMHIPNRGVPSTYRYARSQPGPVQACVRCPLPSAVQMQEHRAHPEPSPNDAPAHPFQLLYPDSS